MLDGSPLAKNASPYSGSESIKTRVISTVLALQGTKPPLKYQPPFSPLKQFLGYGTRVFLLHQLKKTIRPQRGIGEFNP